MKIGDKFIGKVVPGIRSQGMYTGHPTNALFGVEFEYEGYNERSERILNLLLKKYALVTHPETSLKDRGIEIVFAGPKNIADTESAVEAIVSFASRSGLLATARAGIHVHVNVSDLEEEQLKNLLTIYAMIEPAITTWVGEGRADNVFCVPWFKKPMYVEGFAEAASKKADRGLQDYLDKYAALNVKPIYQFGTLEWRHLRSTLDSKRVLDWINIINSWYVLGVKASVKDLIKHTLDTKNPTELLNAMLQHDAALRRTVLYRDLVEEYRVLSHNNALELHHNEIDMRKAWGAAPSIPKGVSKYLKAPPVKAKPPRITDLGRAAPLFAADGGVNPGVERSFMWGWITLNQLELFDGAILTKESATVPGARVSFRVVYDGDPDLEANPVEYDQFILEYVGVR